MSYWSTDASSASSSNSVNSTGATSRARLIIYSKPGCHLCEMMKADMARADCAELYELEEINIESDAELLAQYRYEIPMLMVDGVEAFRHRLTADSFRAYLKKRAR